MAMASLLAGVVGHLQGGDRLLPGPARGQTTRAAARGWPAAAGRRQGATAARSHANSLQIVARKGRSTTGSTPAGRQPAGRGIARKGCRLEGRPPAAAALARAAPVEVPVAGVAAPWQGGCRPQRAATACAGATAATA
ncbi:hypothetical protein GW17_00010825 [Ensete ventricosum]|nr:hypothetical protein GW17_00010825 [Ensete ventricosum]